MSVGWFGYHTDTHPPDWSDCAVWLQLEGNPHETSPDSYDVAAHISGLVEKGVLDRTIVMRLFAQAFGHIPDLA
jgi:hypothetical protein